MSIIMDLKKQILKKQLKTAQKMREIKKRRLKEEDELEEIRKKIMMAKKLDLTPEQKKRLMMRRERVLKNRMKLKKVGKLLISKLNTFADNVNKDFDKIERESKRKMAKKKAIKKVIKMKMAKRKSYGRRMKK